jgi:hypothetical protein
MTEVAQTVRDILVSLYLIVGMVFTLAMILFAFLLYKATKGLINAITRAAENFGKVSDAAVEHIVTPLQDGVSFSKTLGGAAGFFVGFVTGLRGNKTDGDGKGGGSKKEKRFFGLF